MSTIVYYLDCPFSDKEQVKSLGAQWDALAKRWFVPSNLYATMECFNPWRPNDKVFLNCSFDEKEDVKKAGAKWDANVKRWFIICGIGVSPPAKFSKWLKVSPAAAAAAAAAAASTKPSVQPHPPASKPRGNAQDATLLRINENMTIPQLQSECRCRGIKGLSGKNKEWLLEQLEIGTVWQSVVVQHQQQQVMDPKMSAAAKKKEPPPHKKPAATKEPVAATAKSKEQKKKSTLVKDSPAAVGKATTSNKAINWSQLPRVSSNLTMIQLSHELLHRQPNAKGTSNKPKSWFLEQLGDGSIWTTSPTIALQEYGHLLSQMPRVSESLTTVQLMHELLSRQSDHSKGLSKKNKSELLNLVGVGSIWTTGVMVASTAETNANATKATKESAKKAKVPVATKLARKSASAETKTATTTTKATKDTVKAKIPVATKLARKSSINSSSKQTTIPTNNIKQPPNQTEPPPAIAKLPKKESAAAAAGAIQSSTKKEIVKSKIMPTKKPSPAYPPPPSTTSSTSSNHVVLTAAVASSSSVVETTNPKSAVATSKSSAKTMPFQSHMKPPPVYPPSTTSSSSANNVVAVIASSSAVVKTTNPKTKQESSAKKQPTTAKFAAAPEEVKSKASPARKQAAVAKIEPAAKRVKLEKSVEDVMPVVSSTMTVSQLKDEMKARDPNAKGLSGKNKEFFLSRLGIGTELHSSAEYKTKQDVKAQQLHIYQSRCHVHLLADTSVLRDGKYVYTGRCDVVCDLWICQKTPFRTCERCDWDICKPCFEIASLGSKQDQKREIQSRLDKMAAQQAKAQREWERQEAEELQRQERREQQYERDRENRIQELFGDTLKKFPPNVLTPSDVSRDAENKLRYTVWTRDVHRKQSECDAGREFDSSFASLKEANLRVEYVFHYKNESSEDELYADVDKELTGGLRYMRIEPDGRGSFTVSVLPSETFDILQPDNDKGFHSPKQQPSRKETKYPKHIRNPGAANKNESNKLRFTVWTSCSYDYDPEKNFNSSYDTIEEANERAEYVFYYANPWELPVEEYEFPYVEIDFVSSKTGFRRLECCPDDSQRWTVSVVTSCAFDYIDI